METVLKLGARENASVIMDGEAWTAVYHHKKECGKLLNQTAPLQEEHLTNQSSKMMPCILCPETASWVILFKKWLDLTFSHKDGQILTERQASVLGQISDTDILWFYGMTQY